jgi:hypothetical protein
VFVCAIALGTRRHDIRIVFAERSAEVVEIAARRVRRVRLLLTLDGLLADAGQRSAWSS